MLLTISKICAWAFASFCWILSLISCCFRPLVSSISSSAPMRTVCRNNNSTQLYSTQTLCYYKNPPPGHISPIALFAAMHLQSGTLWTVTLSIVAYSPCLSRDSRYSYSVGLLIRFSSHDCSCPLFLSASATEVFWHSGALQIGLLLLLL